VLEDGQIKEIAMLWLQRHAWWALLVFAASGAIMGLVDLAGGVTWQAEDATGKTIAQITAESISGSRLSDFSVRTDGLHLLALTLLGGAVLLFGFRQNRPWAWWTMWSLVVMTFAQSLLNLGFGATGPAVSGTVVGVLEAAIMLVSAPRFFKQSTQVEDASSLPHRPA
jgi:O-antigen/teichoic acid export membrane protein